MHIPTDGHLIAVLAFVLSRSSIIYLFGVFHDLFIIPMALSYLYPLPS